MAAAQTELNTADARLTTLEIAGDDDLQRLKSDDATADGSDFTLQIGIDKVMAGRRNIDLVDSISLLVW